MERRSRRTARSPASTGKPARKPQPAERGASRSAADACERANDRKPLGARLPPAPQGFPRCAPSGRLPARELLEILGPRPTPTAPLQLQTARSRRLGRGGAVGHKPFKSSWAPAAPWATTCSRHQTSKKQIKLPRPPDLSETI